MVLVVLGSALLLSACGSGGATTAGSTTGATAPSSPSTAATVVATGLPLVRGTFGRVPTITLPSPQPGGYQVKVVSDGKGRVVAQGDQLTVHYIGETWRGAHVFDQSYARGEPVTFPIGVGGLIPGWDEGLVGKKVGSRILLVLPPDKGYGTSGNPQAGIEPTDTLVFVVDIVNATS